MLKAWFICLPTPRNTSGTSIHDDRHGEELELPTRDHDIFPVLSFICCCYTEKIILTQATQCKDSLKITSNRPASNFPSLSFTHSFVHLSDTKVHRQTNSQTDRETDIQTPKQFFLSVRQHICYSALYAIARPSVRPSVTRADQSKTVKVSITKPSPESSPMTLVSWCLTSPWNSKGKIGNGGVE